MTVLIALLSFVLPLFFFPWITDPVWGAKNYLLAAFGLAVLVLTGIKTLKQKKVEYRFKLIDFLVLLFLLTSFISWYQLSLGGRVRSLMWPMGLGTLLGLTLFYLVTRFWHRAKTNLVDYGVLTSGLLVSLVSVVLFVLPEGFNAGWAQYLSVVSLNSWVIRFQFLLVLVIFLIAKIVFLVRENKGELKQWWLGVFLVVYFLGLGVNTYNSIAKKPILLDWFSSWAIAVETFKRKPLFGIGLGNFTEAFNSYRPLEFNLTENWGLSFGASHSWFLQVWTETGIIGLGILLGLVWYSLKRADKKTSWYWFLIGVWGLLVLLPGNLLTLFLLFLGLVMTKKRQSDLKEFKMAVGENNQNLAPTLFFGLSLVILGLSSYFIYKSAKAEFTFYQSLKAVSENRGGDAYNLQNKTISLNPYSVRYRVALSQTSLAIADNLAGQKDLSEDSKNQINVLVSRAVAEAKVATALEPKNVLSWQNLAQIYRQLTGMAKGVSDWAIASYQQAVSLDRLNPTLRIAYGGLLYSMEKYDQAGNQFESAVNLRPSLANAWYNWAWNFKQQGNLEQAVAKLEQAVNLVDRTTADYEKVSKELEDWKKELGKKTVQPPTKPVGKEAETELTKPEPLPTSAVEKPIELSGEAVPKLKE